MMERVPAAAAGETTIVADALFSLVTTTLATVMSAPTSIVIPGTNRAPLKVRLIAALFAPESGLTFVMDGCPMPTVNVAALLVPPGFVIVTLCIPAGAPERIVNVAFADPLLATERLLTVIPGPALTTIPVRKFVPVSVTETELPQLPPVGVSEVNVGAGGTFTTNGKALVVPPAEENVTLCTPRLAAADMLRIADAEVGLPLKLKESITTPGPASAVIPETKLVPVRNI